MTTSSSRGNKELPNVQQIGRGPAEFQLRLQAGEGEGSGLQRGSRGATEADMRPQA